MKRVLSRFGAYTAHLTILSEDSSVKSVDRAKFKGYLRKWSNAKYLLGCALFVDLLTPCAIFSKCMQADETDILGGLTCLLRTVKEIKKLDAKPLDHWPTYASAMQKFAEEEEQHLYQGQVLKNFSEAKRYFENNHEEYCQQVIAYMRTRLSWSDMQLFRDIIFMLATQGWQKIQDEQADVVDGGDECETSLNAIKRLADHFKEPLERAGVNVSEIHCEFEELVVYATQFISLST